MANDRLWVWTGVAGVGGIACYLCAAFLPWPETQLGTSLSLLTVSGFPILSIIYSYGLYTYIAAENESAANRLAFVFAALAFTTVLSMIIVQMAVGGFRAEFTEGLDDITGRGLHRGLRSIDLGLDVAWDMLIGTSLIFTGVAMRRRKGYGAGWGVPSAVLGGALIILNASTFPNPPADAGLFDIGPFIGVFMMAVAARLTFLGFRSS
jgi:hypothetical protein